MTETIRAYLHGGRFSGQRERCLQVRELW